MKYVIAIIKPYKLDDVGRIGVAGMSVSEIKGFGRQKGQTEIYRGAEYSTNMLPKVKMEIAVSDALAPQVVETIQQVANDGAIGDGKIFVLDVEAAMRIRTGETGENALLSLQAGLANLDQSDAIGGNLSDLPHRTNLSAGTANFDFCEHLCVRANPFAIVLEIVYKSFCRQVLYSWCSCLP